MTGYALVLLAKEAEREAKYRRWVYSKWVGEGKMTAELAELRIDMMEEIAARLAELAEAENPQGRLL